MIQDTTTSIEKPPKVPETQTNGHSAQSPAFVLPQAVSPQPVPENADYDDPALYFNQELSWVDFNWRVLHQALDERTPLLERVRFIAITASNLDEFVQKRVGGLKRQEAAGVRSLSLDGRMPTEQLQMLRESLLAMHHVLTETWQQTLKPALRQQLGIVICDYEDLSPQQRGKLHQHFRTQIYPILTPLAVDPGRPFPFISNLSISLAIILKYPGRDTVHFTRLKIPTQRWLQVDADHDDDTNIYFLPVEQLISYHIGELFPGMEVVSVHPFRITRNADLNRDEEEADDLVAMISAELRERRFAPVVRLEVDHAMPEYDRRLLLRELGLTQEDIYESTAMLSLSDCFEIANIDKPEAQFPDWEPVVPSRLEEGIETKDIRNIFAIIRQGDIFVHHPYESFVSSTLRFIAEAAADPNVLAIKQTLYRTASDSPIIKALIQAAEKGKQVAVLVEVKARFDEANNIEWARMLENAGVHVAYGLVGLKTHTKTTLVVRRDQNDAIRTYCHVGTGNYNHKTARLYTDFGLITCNPELGHDIVKLFHYLTGHAPKQEYEKVMVAPNKMRTVFYELIDREIKNQEQHGNGRIIAKMNALADHDIIQRLYRASQAGVSIDLIVRGHSSLRPGLPGYSDNIRIISILGRFLEHDRIYYFHNNGQPQTFIGSADWRARNLNTRIELIVPIEDPTSQERLIQLLNDALSDNCSVWDLDANGRYTLRYPSLDQPVYHFQQMLMNQALTHAQVSSL